MEIPFYHLLSFSKSLLIDVIREQIKDYGLKYIRAIVRFLFGNPMTQYMLMLM